MRAAPLLLLSLLAAAPARAETLLLKRLDDSEITVELEPPAEGERAAVAVLLPQVVCEDGEAEATPPGVTAPKGTARLAIGAGDADCGASVERRALDVLTVLAHLRNRAPWWNGRMHLVGLDDGATVAALAGSLAPETESLVLIEPPAARSSRLANLLVHLDAPVLLMEAEKPSRPLRMSADPLMKGVKDLTVKTARGQDATAWRGVWSRPAPGHPAWAAAYALAGQFVAAHEPAPRAAAAKAEAPKRAVTRAAKSPAAAKPRKTARADAPRPRATAARIQLSPATVAPKVAPASVGLRASLPATPGPRPGTGPAGLRRTSGRSQPSTARRP